MLKAIASLGAFEVSIERANGASGSWRQYALGAPGAMLVADDGARATVRVPHAAIEEQVVGSALSIASVRASEGDAPRLFDGRLDTDWGTRQLGREWLVAELAESRSVGGVSLAIQKHASGFPRHLIIEVSSDGDRFEPVWEGNGATPAFLAVLRSPTAAWWRIAFPPRDARFVRFRQTVRSRMRWVVPELQINSPAK